MLEQSHIISYDNETRQRSYMEKSFECLESSHPLNWEGIIVEHLRSIESFSKEIYFKDFFFGLALNDFEIQIDNKSIVVLKDDIFVTPMNYPFRIDNPNDCETLMMTISFDFIKSYFHDTLLDQVSFLNNYQIRDHNMNYLIKLIYDQAKEGTSFNDLYLKNLFTTFVSYYVLNYSDYSKKEENHILTQDCFVKIDKYIDENFSTDVSYKDISSLSGMSNYSFLNEFKKLTNYTPHQYILNRKLEKAKDLLLHSPLSITDISYELGFSDSSHFSKFFKKYTLIAPSAYKEKHL